VTGATETLPAFETTRIFAVCPAPLVPLGGGASSTSTTPDGALDETFPFPEAGNRWDSVLTNASSRRSFDVTPYAVCAKR
jgi:hypothetical protein